MRWVRALTLAVVAACGGNGGGDADAGDASACPPLPDEAERCGATCGDGQIDECWSRVPGEGECERWVMRTEACDGQAIGTTCEQLGYYGGAVACGLACRVDERDCRSCAAGISCAAFGTELTDKGAAVNGSRVALLGDRAVSFVDGFAVVATRTFDGAVGSVVGVPGGWLVAHAGPAQIAVTNLDGQVSDVRTLATDRVPTLTYGPSGRVLLAWTEPGAGVTTRLHVAIANADATIAVAGAGLFDAPGGAFATATDGTSFFAAADGRLARIAPDGTTVVNVGFVSTAGNPEPTIHLAWGETTGWYVAETQPGGYLAQRFDASGAAVGVPVGLALDDALVDVVADRDDLLLLDFANELVEAPTRLAVKRLAPNGTYGPPVEVGVGMAGARMAMRGDELLVTWETPTGGALAAMPPPP